MSYHGGLVNPTYWLISEFIDSDRHELRNHSNKMKKKTYTLIHRSSATHCMIKNIFKNNCYF